MNPFILKYSQKLKRLIIYTSIFLVLGAFISFLYLAKTDSTFKALAIGYFFSLSLVIVLNIVQTTVINKIHVFNPLQQWTIRTLVYTISLSAVYLAGLLFQSAILSPDISLEAIIGEKLWSGFVSFISSPFDLEIADSLFREEYRSVLIPFFAVILLITLISLVGSYVEMRWQHNRQQQAINHAEIMALKAQIEPHFLFNSLNTIASEIKFNPDKAEKLILKLSDILRFLFDNSSKEMVLVEKEIEFLNKYLDLIKARFTEKLIIKTDLSFSDNTVMMPALLLQPIVENSLRHGWMGGDGPLKISLSCEECQDKLVFTIRDNGQGMTESRLKKVPIAGHALANIGERLRLLYKKDDLLQIDSEYGRGTTVRVKIPKR